MRKNSLVLYLTLIICFFFAGCSGSGSDNIKIGDLKSACDCIDAFETIFDDIQKVVGKTSRYSDLNERQQERVRELSRIHKMVDDYCSPQFGFREIEQCSNYERTRQKFLAVENFILY